MQAAFGIAGTQFRGRRFPFLIGSASDSKTGGYFNGTMQRTQGASLHTSEACIGGVRQAAKRALLNALISAGLGNRTMLPNKNVTMLKSRALLILTVPTGLTMLNGTRDIFCWHRFWAQQKSPNLLGLTEAD